MDKKSERHDRKEEKEEENWWRVIWKNNCGRVNKQKRKKKSIGRHEMLFLHGSTKTNE